MSHTGGSLQAEVDVARSRQPKWISGASLAVGVVIGLLVAVYAHNSQADTGTASDVGFLIDFAVSAAFWFGITYLVLYVGWRMFRTSGVVTPSSLGRDPRIRAMREVQGLTASPADDQREVALEIETLCNCGLVKSSRAGSSLRGDGVDVCNRCSKPLGFTVKATTVAALPKDRATSIGDSSGAADEETETFLSLPSGAALEDPRTRVDGEPNLAGGISRLARLLAQGDLTDSEFRLLAARLLENDEAD